MIKKGLLIVTIAASVTGVCFAQTGFETMPKNTITVDFGPTIIGAAIGAAGSIIGKEDLNTSGFGIAAQYERQILERLSAAGRFAYLGGGAGISTESGGYTAELEMNLSSFSLEGHIRYFPFGKTFFLDGMLGYANLSADFSGEVITTKYGVKQKESTNFTASRSYFKLGAKIGWRIDFGNPGGFIFEPSFGYYGGIGMGNTLVEQLKNRVGGELDELDQLDDVSAILENVIFIGGPRLALSFGWRF
jgi:hypothetical protein